MTLASPPRVAVASDQPLVADVISAALSGKGLSSVLVTWPPGPSRGAQEKEQRPDGAELDVALMVCDLDRVARMRATIKLLVGVPASWVVLTGVPRGPLWGALLDIGVVHVAPSTLGLDEVTELLWAVAEGRLVMSESERRELVEAWQAALAQHDEIMARLVTMTPRETQVLQLLYAGSPVRSIARELDVAEATVRTQVKRVLRKLDVRSQLGAVAAFEEVRRGEASSGTDLITTMWLRRHLRASCAPVS